MASARRLMTLFICAIRVPIGQTHRSFQEFSRGDLVKDHVRIGRYPLNTRNKATKIGMALWCEFWRPFGVFSGLNLLLMLINAPRQTLKKRGTPKAFARHGGQAERAEENKVFLSPTFNLRFSPSRRLYRAGGLGFLLFMLSVPSVSFAVT